MPRPVIGVSAEFTEIDIHDSRMAAHVATTSYLRAVEKAGGIPVVLPITVDAEAVAAMVARVDGVLITGGVDVDPASYGQDPAPEVGETQPDRDAFEADLVHTLVERNVPTLAICRGVQSVAVALGGALRQHVDDHMRPDLYNATVHRVTIESDSRLAAIVGTTDLEVNSLHHQVVQDAPSGTRVVARNEDGHIEGLEVDGADRVLAVQWHPEMLRHRAEHLALFEDLVRNAS